MTPRQIADTLQIRVSTVEEYARREVLPSIKLGRHRRFIKSEVERAIVRLQSQLSAAAAGSAIKNTTRHRATSAWLKSQWITQLLEIRRQDFGPPASRAKIEMLLGQDRVSGLVPACRCCSPRERRNHRGLDVDLVDSQQRVPDIVCLRVCMVWCDGMGQW